MILRIAKKVIPGPLMGKMRRFARTRLPVRVQSKLKAWERGAQTSESHDTRSVLARQDDMFQLMEQRMLALESMLFERVEDLDRRLSMVEENSDPMLDDAQYARLQETFHHAARRDALYAWLIDEYIPGESRVLDIGCGDGAFLEALRGKSRRGQGVDASPCAVAACRRRKLDAVEADCIEFLEAQPDASADAIVSLHVIEHLPGPKVVRMIGEARRVLRPGGLLLLETPKVASLFDLSQYYFIDPTHRSPRHHDLLAFICRDAGFTDVEVADAPTGEDAGKLKVGPDGDIASASEIADGLEEDDRVPVIETTGEGGRGSAALATASIEARPRLENGRLARLEERIDVLARRQRENMTVLNEWLFVARDVRILARAPGGDGRSGR